ncbi:LysR family transcriptional regulator [Mycolicibacterium conceptionense]|jgi:DNA-binding transcriptional LysR family regulator|uniref:LysR family transcriptional regulator n=2 Tax=Mycolicibacterium TaxID=1866885 RepID=A0A0J8U2U7_9MYCO|nr:MULTISPECIES: LysR family transcriptional regulator [Mycolicibacterium]KLI07503.1 LysR family transcriptional regulator [Mycolicibacterium senegalense]KLO50778.1 LysR family transcriptional regulator [Mycolicibacterium senegalense]KMV15821.1 LysR family transcriptional regulator [Mycolicibacterium conceptionense]OBK04869.1 LysR family transcriptional regulator [Mycolicibacterium conceptionense]OMB72053.1 LysR family transcriptional regulator [Mycolicibacterium conceptionense]
MLDLRRMMLLADLADLGSVTAVAEHRNITSSAVSQQLRVLEDEAGAVLFRRDGRTLGLTRSGQVLAEHVRRVLVAVDEAMSAVAETRDRVSGQVAIATFNMGIPTLAVPLMQHLSNKEPNLRVQVQQETSVAAVRLLRQGDVDIAITCHYDFLGPDLSGGLTTVGLLVEPLVLLAPTHSHRRIRKQGLSALADGSWVTGPQASGLEIAAVHACEGAGFTPQIKHRLIGAQNICELAATEVASAIVPRLSVPANLEGLIVGGLQLGGRAISAVVRAGRQRDPNIALILDALRTIAERALPPHSAEPLGVAS